MSYEQGFFLKIKGYVDSHKAGKTSLHDFVHLLETAYHYKQKGKPEIVDICEDPESREQFPSAIMQAEDGLDHMEEGFDYLFQYCERPSDGSLLDMGLKSLKMCTDCFNQAREMALDASEEADVRGFI